MCSQHNQSGPYVFEIAQTDGLLGRGAYGEVRKYVLKDGRTVAGKKIHELLLTDGPEQSMNTHIIAESEKLSQLSHPNIVQYIGLAYRNTVCPILLTELLPMSLSDYLDQSNEQEEIIPSGTKRSILLDVSLGLQYLHSKNVIHGDLTVKKVLLTEEKKAKICGFGMSKVFDPEKLYMELPGCPGTVLYMPPEALTADCFEVERTDLDRLDVFSFGVLILHIFTQKWPDPSDLFDENPQPRKETERRQQYIDEVRNCTFRQLAVHCLSNQPRERPSSSDVVQRIRVESPVDFQSVDVSGTKQQETTRVSPVSLRDSSSSDGGNQDYVYGAAFQLPCDVDDSILPSNGPTILAVMRATKDITDWSILALLLKLSPAEFKNIESATRDKQEQQKNIIIKWLDSGTASWAVLVNALNDDLVKQGAIANEIAKKYPKRVLKK